MSKGIQQVRDRIVCELNAARSYLRYENCGWCEMQSEELTDMANAMASANGSPGGSWRTRSMGEALAFLAFAGYLNADAQSHAARKHGWNRGPRYIGVSAWEQVS